MAIEAKRACGYRHVGGTYLIGEGMHFICDRLPFELRPCPLCGAGPKFSRGWQWIENMRTYFGYHVDVEPKNHCKDPETCPICYPASERCGLMSVSSAVYTPGSFVEEALEQGVSKRIAAVPRGLELGRTWVLLSHKKVPFSPDGELFKGACKPDLREAIFYAFKPSRVEKVITETQALDPKLMENLRKRMITPVVVPDDDPDHNLKGV